MLCAHTVVFDNKLEVVFDENDDESVMIDLDARLPAWNEACIEEELNERLKAC